MPRVLAERVEVVLSVDQLLSAIRQLGPDERDIIRGELASDWSQRLDRLLSQVWTRVEREPITDTEIEREVEAARTARHARCGH
jgi:hypothetical protein